VKTNTVRVPRDAVLPIIERYRREAAEDGFPSKRSAIRAFQRLKGACDEVLRALDALPQELKTFWAVPLERAAAQIESEAALRLHRLRENHGKLWRPRAPRVTFENAIGELFVSCGGRPTTYDPRQYVEPKGGEGERGGQLAGTLLKAYELAGIEAPADLRPVLNRLCKRAKNPRSGSILGKYLRNAPPK